MIDFPFSQSWYFGERFFLQLSGQLAVPLYPREDICFFAVLKDEDLERARLGWDSRELINPRLDYHSWWADFRMKLNKHSGIRLRTESLKNTLPRQSLAQKKKEEIQLKFSAWWALDERPAIACL